MLPPTLWHVNILSPCIPSNACLLVGKLLPNSIFIFQFISFILELPSTALKPSPFFEPLNYILIAGLTQMSVRTVSFLNFIGKNVTQYTSILIIQNGVAVVCKFMFIRWWQATYNDYANIFIKQISKFQNMTTTKHA